MPDELVSVENSKLRKGIILAGGKGTRLFPVTGYINKHLLPVYDKPLIYYPLTTLMLAGMRDILVISDSNGLPSLKQALGDGSQWGVHLTYGEQDTPAGIAQGLLIAEDFVAGEPFSLVLGDNIFYGRGFATLLSDAGTAATHSKAVVFTQWVSNPEDYGVLTTDREGTPLLLVEKPRDPRSHEAVTGLYFYDHRAIELVKTLVPSERGELEITDLNRLYMEKGDLVPVHLGRGFVWFDAGTTHNLLLASQLVEVMQMRQRTGIAFPEEVAYRVGLIDLDAFCGLVASMPVSAYRHYLDTLVEEFQESDG